MCEQLCNEEYYFRDLTATRAVEILSNPEQLTLPSDYDGPIRFLVRQGVAFDAIEKEICSWRPLGGFGMSSVLGHRF